MLWAQTTRSEGSAVQPRAPRAMMAVGAVEAVEAVGAEEVALGLDDIRGAAATAIAVEIAERRGKRGNRQAMQRRRRDDAA